MQEKYKQITAIIAIVLLAGLFIFAGCSDNNKSNNPNPPGPQPTHLVTISNFAYSPATITVAPGDTVTWRNNDSAPHTVTSNSGSELNSPQLSQGQTYEHVFSAAGSFAYHCTIHPSMQGTVAVQ